MKNRIKEACFSFLALFLFACGFSAALFIGMLLMPFAFIAVFVLAIREIIIWKRKLNPLDPSVPVPRKGKSGIVRQMLYSTTTKNNRAA
jgi:hypothetical protein